MPAESMREAGGASPVVLTATPNPKVRRRWRLALKDEFSVRDVTKPRELARALAELKPSVLLLDLGLREVHGVAGVSGLRRFSGSTKIISLAPEPDEEEALLALKAGARGYCRRDLSTSQLRRAVERIREGEIWVSRRVVAALVDELAEAMERRYERPAYPARVREGGIGSAGSQAQAIPRSVNRLTPREAEIAALVQAGASNKEIATSLHLSEKTVKARLTTIFRKLGISTRLQLALVRAQSPQIAD